MNKKNKRVRHLGRKVNNLVMLLMLVSMTLMVILCIYMFNHQTMRMLENRCVNGTNMLAYELERLEEESQGVYTSAPLGSLAGDEQWTEEEHPLKNGDRYDITFGEAGFFRLSIRNSSGAVDAYYFMVAE